MVIAVHIVLQVFGMTSKTEFNMSRDWFPVSQILSTTDQIRSMLSSPRAKVISSGISFGPAAFPNFMFFEAQLTPPSRNHRDYVLSIPCLFSLRLRKLVFPQKFGTTAAKFVCHLVKISMGNYDAKNY